MSPLTTESGNDTILPASGKIAVVGTGISGLSATWLLNKNHSVTVYEQNDYVGGHSNTADIEVEGRTMPVDTGFIVFNPVNYPNLVALFDHLDVPSKASDMSFSASLNDGGFEYSGTSLAGLLAQPSNILRPRFVLMVRDITRFYKQARQMIDDPSLAAMTLKDFLANNRYSDAFVYYHLMPMGAAIWSSSVRQMLDFPTQTFLRFFDNHGLLQMTDRPEWRTVTGGSREYVKRLTADFADSIRTSHPVAQVKRHGDTHTVITADGHREEFDHVIFACHADEALKLITKTTDQERAILRSVPYQSNTAFLHTDINLMPRRRRAWASWNYLGTGNNSEDQVLCVTYLMNLLQSLPTEIPVMVTLNPCKEIASDKIIRTYNYDHPLFNVAAIQNQPKLWGLQGNLNTWFCGAYFGSGFHEDGIQSGLAVAEKMGGVKRPWTVPNPSARIGLCPEGAPLGDPEVVPA